MFHFHEMEIITCVLGRIKLELWQETVTSSVFIWQLTETSRPRGFHTLPGEWSPFWFSLREQMTEWTERSSGKDQDVQISMVDRSMSSAAPTLPFCVPGHLPFPGSPRVLIELASCSLSSSRWTLPCFTTTGALLCCLEFGDGSLMSRAHEYDVSNYRDSGRMALLFCLHLKNCVEGCSGSHKRFSLNETIRLIAAILILFH